MRTDDYNNIERAVLGTIIFEPKKLKSVKEHISEDTFSTSIHRDIYLSMLELDAEKVEIYDNLILKLIIKHPNIETHLLEIISFTPLSNIQSYLTMLQEIHIKREIRTCVQDLNEETITIFEFKEKISKIVNIYKSAEQENYEKIDFDKLPKFFGSLIRDLARLNNYPISMVLSVVLASASGLIGARAKISNGFNITVFPIIWSIIVAPSSLSAKSTLFKFSKKCIFGNLQDNLYVKYEKELKEYKKSNVNVSNTMPHPKLLIFANDGTPEAKIQSLAQNQNGGIVYFDEMKAELERSNKDPRYKALKTSIFDGEPYHKQLVKDGGTYILQNPVLSEIGLITEQWLLEAIQKNDIASGFMARYLFSYNTKLDFQPLQITEYTIDTELYSEIGCFVLEMLNIDRTVSLLFTLDLEAKQYYAEWFNNFSSTVYASETEEEITASYRLSTYVLKFALIFYIFENAYKQINVVATKQYNITLEYIQTAIYVMEIFRNENHKILKLFEKNQKLNFKIDNMAEKLQKKIDFSKDKKITKTEACNGIRGLTTKKLENLIEQGLFRIEKIGRTSYVLEA